MSTLIDEKKVLISPQDAQSKTAEFRHFRKMLKRALLTKFEHLDTLEDEKVLIVVVFTRAHARPSGPAAQRP
jgi:hypothetical protein